MRITSPVLDLSIYTGQHALIIVAYTLYVIKFIPVAMCLFNMIGV